MTEEEGDHKFEPPAAQIRLSGIAALLAIAEVITAEERAEPVCRAMDMGRLAREPKPNLAQSISTSKLKPHLIRWQTTTIGACLATSRLSFVSSQSPHVGAPPNSAKAGSGLIRLL